MKGRDWYDFLFFIARGVPVDLNHLDARLRQSGHWAKADALGIADLRRLLDERIESVNWTQASEDATPFVRDPRALELWGKDLFREAAARITEL